MGWYTWWCLGYYMVPRKATEPLAWQAYAVGFFHPFVLSPLDTFIILIFDHSLKTYLLSFYSLPGIMLYWYLVVPYQVVLGMKRGESFSWLCSKFIPSRVLRGPYNTRYYWPVPPTSMCKVCFVYVQLTELSLWFTDRDLCNRH